MRGRSWRTGRPAPRFRWPTSVLPIWPVRQADGVRRSLSGRAASAPAARARWACVPRRSRRRPGRARCRNHRAPRGRSGAAGRPTAVTTAAAPSAVARRQPGAGHDAGHLVELERRRRPGRRRSRLGEELADVALRDAAAVQDRRPSRAPLRPRRASREARPGSRRPSPPRRRRVAFRPVPIAQTGS